MANISETSRFCAIVDPFSHSTDYIQALHKEGFKVIAIMSQPQPAQYLYQRFSTIPIEEIIQFSGDLPGLARALSAQRVEFVIVGMESGLALADQLGQLMGTPSTNDPNTSKSRIFKYEMVEAVRAAGLRAAKQFKSGNIQELLRWAESNKTWPLVLKPNHSAGAHLVELCKNLEDLEQAARKSLGDISAFEKKIDEVVVQEFHQGTEYSVDSASYQGHHEVCGIWQFKRAKINGANFVYDTKFLLPSSGQIQSELIQYARSVLNAVGMKFGPSNMELIYSSKGPVLVEVNSRLAGLTTPKHTKACTGRSHFDAALEALLHPQSFVSNSQKQYQIQKNGQAIFLQTKALGLAINPSAIEKIKNLPSFFNLNMYYPEDSLLPLTIDMSTMPGYVQLVHENPQQINDDTVIIREIEKTELYIPFKSSKQMNKYLSNEGSPFLNESSFAVKVLYAPSMTSLRTQASEKLVIQSSRIRRPCLDYRTELGTYLNSCYTLASGPVVLCGLWHPWYELVIDILLKQRKPFLVSLKMLSHILPKERLEELKKYCSNLDIPLTGVGLHPSYFLNTASLKNLGLRYGTDQLMDVYQMLEISELGEEGFFPLVISGAPHFEKSSMGTRWIQRESEFSVLKFLQHEKKRGIPMLLRGTPELFYSLLNSPVISQQFAKIDSSKAVNFQLLPSEIKPSETGLDHEFLRQSSNFHKEITEFWGRELDSVATPYDEALKSLGLRPQKE